MIFKNFYCNDLLFDSINLLSADSRTYSKKFTRQAGNQSLRLLVYGEWMGTLVSREENVHIILLFTFI